MHTIETVGARVSRWGEAPVWWDGALLHVDVEGHAVVRVRPASGLELLEEGKVDGPPVRSPARPSDAVAWHERVWDVGERVGTVVPRRRGGMVIAGASGFRLLDESGGSPEFVADPEADLPDNRFNDGKCSPDGRFFAGAISLSRRPGAARLYRLDPDWSVHEVFGPVTNSNGIGWSPDGGTVYYIDSPRREVLAFDYEDGRLLAPRTAFATAAVPGTPDGLAVDSAGRLWIAFCHGGRVVCFDPQSGQPVEQVELPCRETTACAFGGAGLTDLYVTTGIPSDLAEPLAGRLFVVRGLATRGLPANAFAG